MRERELYSSARAESGGVGSKGGRSIWLQSQGEAYRTELLLFEPIVVKIIAFE